MVSPSLHAAVMIAVLAATAAVSVWARRGRPSQKRILLAILGGGFFFVASTGLTLHLCLSGNPISQLLVGSLCIFACLAFPSSPRLAIGAALGTALLMGFACHDYLEHVHGPDFTGNPEGGRRRSALLEESQLREARKLLEELALTDDAPHSPGWLKDTVPAVREARRFEERGLLLPFSRQEATACWHTPFTGLWSRRAIPTALWYPGGKLKDAALRLECREP